MITDSIGSSETGFGAPASSQRVSTTWADRGSRSTAAPSCSTTTATREAGFGCQGRHRQEDNIPVGYYRDEKKTAETFRTINGVRYAIPGDYARVEEDGTVTMLGRGSVSINSGGEKIIPRKSKPR